jgi:bacteriocin-like protein
MLISSHASQCYNGATKEETTMRKKTSKSKAKSADKLLKTSKKKDIVLTEKELDKVTGGRKAGKDQQEYLKIKLQDVIIT